ncbi:hypothetical protein D9M71_547510 [compost metagenome]
MPARAPASIAMLHTVMRASMLGARMVLPANSITWPVAPAVPMRPISASAMSLAATPLPSSPSTRTSIDLGFFIHRHCAASTCSTSEVPMPNAKAANAPCVEVCESPQAMDMPGKVAPRSGPTTCRMPWRGSSMPKLTMPFSSQLRSSASTCSRLTGSAMPWLRAVVGTLWSAVASTEAARHTLRPFRRSPSKACGLVTSLTRWRSI